MIQKAAIFFIAAFFVSLLHLMKCLYKIFFLLIVCFRGESTYAQVNLVPNPGFEDTLLCSSSMTSLNQLPAIDWLQHGTVDYSNNLYTYCTYSGGGGSGLVPWNGAGYQNSHTGNAYIGIVTIESSTFKYYREYIQSKLIDTLKTGKTYCVSFWYNEDNFTRYAIDRLGVYLSLNGINLSSSPPFIQYNQQINTPAGQFLNDTLNWRQYKTTYTAIGNETYITVGNFYDSLHTNTQLYPNVGSGWADSYYLLDDISIIPIDLAPYAGRDTSINLGDSTYIGRQSEIGLDEDCMWFVSGNSTAFDTVAGTWIKPTALGTHSYVVEQNICGTITYDTVSVFVTPAGLQIYSINNLINIYPNPASNTISLSINGISNCKNSTITIQNTLGETIKKIPFSKDISVSDLAEGCYFIQVTLQTEETYKAKFIKQ
jgi:hypothetical protein